MYFHTHLVLVFPEDLLHCLALSLVVHRNITLLLTSSGDEGSENVVNAHVFLPKPWHLCFFSALSKFFIKIFCVRAGLSLYSMCLCVICMHVCLCVCIWGSEEDVSVLCLIPLR